MKYQVLKIKFIKSENNCQCPTICPAMPVPAPTSNIFIVLLVSKSSLVIPETKRSLVFANNPMSCKMLNYETL